MARTDAEAARCADFTRAGRDARTGYAADRMAEYARDWSGRAAEDAARHFEVTPRTITRWRAALQLPDARRPRRERTTGGPR